MKFEEAIKYARDGKRITREGWDGRGMCVCMTKGCIIPVEDWVAKSSSQDITEAERERGCVVVGNHLDMIFSKGTRIIGWFPGQIDMMAEDWYVVE